MRFVVSHTQAKTAEQRAERWRLLLKRGTKHASGGLLHRKVGWVAPYRWYG